MRVIYPRSTIALALVAMVLGATAAHGLEQGPGDVRGVWSADRYVLANGSEHPLRGQIHFDRSRWSVLFFVLDETGEPVRASAEGGTYEVRADTVVFSHLFNYSSGAAVEGMEAAEMRMVARAGDAPLEPTRFGVQGDRLTLFFPSGNQMQFVDTDVVDEAEGDRADVLATVGELLGALGAGDGQRMTQLTVPGAVFWAVSEDSETEPRRTPIEEFVGGLDPAAGMLERIWNASVAVDGDIAQVWAPYDFYRSGSFSHCGTDAFHLIRRRGEWRVSTIMYTVQTRACPDSRLGPVPGGDR